MDAAASLPDRSSCSGKSFCGRNNRAFGQRRQASARQMRRIVIWMTVRIYNGIRRLKGGFGPQPLEQMTVQRGKPRHTRIVERVYPDADAAQLHGNACICAQRNTDRHSARRQFFVWMARFSAFSAASRMVSVTVG